MSEWIDAKTEDATPYFSSTESSGTGSGIYLTPVEVHVPTGGDPGVSLHPEPEQAPPGRPTPSERQRTVQACDKCRERKTKCSGEHPVCQRCTTRGLICQYSSREPRTRGPSKARLRNAISSADLRSSPNPRVYSHGPQHSQQLRNYHSQNYESLSDYRSLRRVSSIPATLRTDEPSELPPNTATFETIREYTQPFTFDENAPQYHNPPPLQYTQSDPRTSQLRDMRRVQSHSTLIVDGFSGQQSYTQRWASQGSLSPSAMPLFDPTLDSRLLSSGARSDTTSQPRPSPKVRPWGYQSDGSTGSEPLTNDINIEYSPASSEDVPEPSSCPSTFLNYPQFSDPDVGLNLSVPSQDGCSPQFLSPSLYVSGEHYTSPGVTIAHPSDSDMHAGYEQYVYH
ncbi:Xylanolytic transcriptional activator xlnR [Termitomyces sp. J132]|nr:Xylanolytic transcriptional activator xlnR [Termitomyces sp. J132]